MAKLGISSNHADVMHWFPRHGETMDSFRNAVKERLRADDKKEEKKYYRVQVGAFTSKSNAEAQLGKVKKAGFTDAYIKYN